MTCGKGLVKEPLLLYIKDFLERYIIKQYIQYIIPVVQSLVLMVCKMRVSGWRSWKRFGLSIMLLGVSPSNVKLTNSHQQAFNSKLLGFLDRDHNNIIGTLKIYLCLSHIGKHIAYFLVLSTRMCCALHPYITLTVPEVAGTENRVNSNLPFTLDPHCMLTCSHSHQGQLLLSLLLLLLLR